MFQPLLKPQQLRQVTGSCRLIFPVCIRVNLEPTVEEKNAGIAPVMMTTYVGFHEISYKVGPPR